MYLVLVFFLLFISISIFYLNTKEGFKTDFKEVLPITIPEGDKSIQVPNIIEGRVDKYIAFGGDIHIKKDNCIEFAKGEKKLSDSVKIGHNLNSLYIKGVGNDINKTENLNITLHSIVDITKNLKVAESIECQTLNITSDQRVKHKMSVLSSKSSLDQVRALIPTQFQYKNGTKPVYGFIAQEVQTVVPTCVTSQKSDITNIYDTATLTNRLLTFKHFNTSGLAYKGPILYPKLKLKLKDQDQYVSIVRIVDDYTVEIDIEEADAEVLVYGQEVDDFLTIDKNQLFTLTTSALQALDHQVQALDRELKEEQEKNKTTFHRILQRLSKLEAK